MLRRVGSAARPSAASTTIAAPSRSRRGSARLTPKLTVIISGGFSLAYHKVLPDFERLTGVAVTTLSGASQGNGPKTIKHQLEAGADIDVVIMSKEGLGELIALGRIAAGSDAELATVPLGAAVRQGQPKPDLGSVDAFKRAVLAARLVAIPASTSGIFLKDEVFPTLGIADKVTFRVMARGTESTALLAAGEADLALGPISELVDQAGIEPVGVLPDEIQLIQMFTAAIVNTSRHVEQARRLIEFLISEKAEAAISASGMEPVGKRRKA